MALQSTAIGSNLWAAPVFVTVCQPRSIITSLSLTSKEFHSGISKARISCRERLMDLLTQVAVWERLMQLAGIFLLTQLHPSSSVATLSSFLQASHHITVTPSMRKHPFFAHAMLSPTKVQDLWIYSVIKSMEWPQVLDLNKKFSSSQEMPI